MTFVETSNLSGAALSIRGNTIWTVERVDRLKQLWADGLTASQIGAEMGVSRNSIIGKKDRLGLDDRFAHGIPWKVSGRVPRPRAIAGTGERAPRVRNTTRIKAKLAGFDPGMDDYVPIDAPPASIPVYSLFDLTDIHCRWPIGDPDKPGFHYCGGHAPTGRPYCRAHHRIAYQPPVPRRDRRGRI